MPQTFRLNQALLLQLWRICVVLTLAMFFSTICRLLPANCNCKTESNERDNRQNYDTNIFSGLGVNVGPIHYSEH